MSRRKIIDVGVRLIMIINNDYRNIMHICLCKGANSAGIRTEEKTLPSHDHHRYSVHVQTAGDLYWIGENHVRDDHGH